MLLKKEGNSLVRVTHRRGHVTTVQNIPIGYWIQRAYYLKGFGKKLPELETENKQCSTPRKRLWAYKLTHCKSSSTV